jgi:hypothetical protein
MDDARKRQFYAIVGRAYAHRIPLARLKCLSEKRRREMELLLALRCGR